MSNATTNTFVGTLLKNTKQLLNKANQEIPRFNNFGIKKVIIGDSPNLDGSILPAFEIYLGDTVAEKQQGIGKNYRADKHYELNVSLIFSDLSETLEMPEVYEATDALHSYFMENSSELTKDLGHHPAIQFGNLKHGIKYKILNGKEQFINASNFQVLILRRNRVTSRRGR